MWVWRRRSMTARGVRICICVYCVCELLLEKPHLTGRCLDNLLRPPQFCERVACLSSSLRGWNWQVDFIFWSKTRWGGGGGGTQWEMEGLKKKVWQYFLRGLSEHWQYGWLFQQLWVMSTIQLGWQNAYIAHLDNEVAEIYVCPQPQALKTHSESEYTMHTRTYMLCLLHLHLYGV